FRSVRARGRLRRARCRLRRRLRPPPRRPDRRRAPPGPGRHHRAAGVTIPHPGARDVTTFRRRVGASIASTFVCWTWVGVAVVAGAALEHPPEHDMPSPPRGEHGGLVALGVVSLALAVYHLVVAVSLLAGRRRAQRAGTTTAAIAGAVAAAYAAPATGSPTLVLGAVVGLFGEITLACLPLPRSPTADRRHAGPDGLTHHAPPGVRPLPATDPGHRDLAVAGAIAAVVVAAPTAWAGLGVGAVGIGMFLLDRDVSAYHRGSAGACVVTIPSLLIGAAFMASATCLVALGVAHLLGRPWPSSTGLATGAAPVDTGHGPPSGPHGGIPERRASVGTPAVPVDQRPSGPGATTIVAAVAAAVTALAGSWVGLSGIVGPELGGA